MRTDLKIGDEIIPLYFGMVAFEEMQKLVSNYLGSNKYATDVVWAGYLNACAIEAAVPIHRYSDIMAKLEEYFFDEANQISNLNEVLAAFENSKAGSKIFEVIDKTIESIETIKKKMEKPSKKPRTTRSKK